MKTELDQEAPKIIPPYLPYRSFANTISGWRDKMPARIDRSVLGSYAGAMQTWVLSALRYFGLIDANGQPTESLKRLAQADGPERQKVLVQLLRANYAFIFTAQFDLSKATPAQLQERVKATGAQGETAKKSLSFFLAMCKDAGLSLSPYLRTRQVRQPRAGNGRKTTKRPAQSSNQGGVDDGDGETDGPASAAMKTITLTKAGGSLTLSGAFNLFDLVDDERELVFTIIDKMKEFELKQKQGADDD
ncbi:MAG: DUF5343 domain-containing protein [Acidobacteriota bacterium]